LSGLWELLTGAHGELEAARVLTRLLGAVCEHGEERVRLALEAAVTQRRIEVSGLSAATPVSENVAVPDAVASAMWSKPAVLPIYDQLLLADGGVHE
jgi:hypothetical protein